MSNDERPEFRALEELREVLAALASELATWRRRALKAEAGQAQLGLSQDLVADRERSKSLEAENTELEQRLGVARTRVEELLGRLRFLEEQVATEEQGR
ncbi:MAG: hypothetical protein OEM05_19275 [Myxococcales bacterium]|nr:hypothetical protein [Myxococcales bacterium]